MEPKGLEANVAGIKIVHDSLPTEIRQEKGAIVGNLTDVEREISALQWVMNPDRRKTVEQSDVTSPFSREFRD